MFLNTYYHRVDNYIYVSGISTYLRRYKGPSAATRDRCVGAYFGIVPRYSNIDETDACTAKVGLRRRITCQYEQYQ